MLNQAIWLFFVLLSIGIGIFFNSIHFGVFAFSFVTVIRFCILYFYAENSVLAWEKVMQYLPKHSLSVHRKKSLLCLNFDPSINRSPNKW